MLEWFVSSCVIRHGRQVCPPRNAAGVDDFAAGVLNGDPMLDAQRWGLAYVDMNGAAATGDKKGDTSADASLANATLRPSVDDEEAK